MGLELLIPLIYSVAAPLLTDLVKRGVYALGGKIPPNVVPAVGATLGAVAAAVVPESGMTETMGAVAGLSGTGVHQMMNANKYTKKH